jgi:hypothetical protein
VIALLVASLASLAPATTAVAASARQTTAITFKAADGSQKPLLTCTPSASDATQLELAWADGTRVQWQHGQRSTAATAAFPSSAATAVFPTAFDANGDGSIEIRFRGVVARIDATTLIANRSADGRIVLADSTTEPSGIPPSPLSIAGTGLSAAPADPAAPNTPAVTPPTPVAAGNGALTGLEVLRRLVGTAAGGALPTLDGLTGAGAATGKAEESEAVQAALEKPETMNPALGALLDTTHGMRFLKDVDWKIKTFDNDGESSLGASFRYENSHPFGISGDSTSAVRGKSWDFAMEGNVAFEDDVNPSDFLSARLTLDYFESRGGVRQGLTQEQKARAAALATEASTIEDRDEWLASPAWTELTGLARQVFTTQVYWEAGVDASYETDQEFDAENYTLGAHLALDVKAWNDRSEAGALNVFDYPAALVRYLSGYDVDLRPRGNALPTALVAFDHVDPEGDTPRSEVGDDSSYWRLKLELAYKAPLAIVEGKQYALTAAWRYFSELDPSSAVRAADLDEFDYLTLAIESDEGLFASFSRGQQPFDVDDADVYALGWKFKF